MNEVVRIRMGLKGKDRNRIGELKNEKRKRDWKVKYREIENERK